MGIVPRTNAWLFWRLKIKDSWTKLDYAGTIEADMALAVFLEALRLRSAAKKYARVLGPDLVRDYGASETYNEAQIRAAIRKLKLPEQYAKLGFAAFMTEAEFGELEKGSDYNALHNLYRGFVPHQPTGEMDEAGKYGQRHSVYTPY
jgi:hypothetical protein